MKLGRKTILLGFIALVLVAYAIYFIKEINTPSSIITFNGHEKFRTWQGVASDGEYIYVTTDRNASFELQNFVSVYSMDGEFIKEKIDAYTGKDSKGRFMSFGDAKVINGFLYALVYNHNSGGAQEPVENRESRVVKYELPSLDVAEEHSVGIGTAESIDFNKDSFWVVYHDLQHIKRFDTDFKLVSSYELNASFEKEGGYQGIIFEGDDLFVNLHGSNEFNMEYAFGLDHYRFNGEKFEYIDRIKPPTYGSGQGIDKIDGKYLWSDRPANQIVITSSVESTQ